MGSTLDELTTSVTAAGDDDSLDVELLTVQRDRLLQRLRLQRDRAIEHYAWYRGEQQPPAVPREYKPAFDRLRKMSRGAWARLVVDTIAERLEVQGVLTTRGQDADQQAWRLLQSNRIDADQRDVHTECLIVGVSYVSVSESEDPESALIVPETALEVTHETARGDRRTVAAALKVADEGGGLFTCELYRRDVVAVWTAQYQDSRRDPLQEGANPNWQGPTVNANTLGEVPIVPFENRATAAIQCESELRELEPIMERIQELELAKLVAANTAVFRQKWATGLEVPRDPETGKQIEPFESAVSRLWVNEKPDGRFGTFEATEIGQYLRAIDSEVAELAAVSRVPSYYLVQSELANPPSAESLLASEAGLVAKVEDRQRTYGESWEQIVRLAASIAGFESISTDVELSLLWRTPERRNPAVVADAAIKLQAVGVPQEALWALVGFSPQEIQRMRVTSAQQQLEAALAQPVAEPSSVSTTTSPVQ